MNMQPPDQPEDTRELGDVIDDLHAELTAEREAREKAEVERIELHQLLSAETTAKFEYKQRAEAAEQKLREAMEQEPVAWMREYPVGKYEIFVGDGWRYAQGFVTKLYRLPSPLATPEERKE